MFNPTTFVNSRPDGIGALEITGEDGNQPDQPRMFGIGEQRNREYA